MLGNQYTQVLCWTAATLGSLVSPVAAAESAGPTVLTSVSSWTYQLQQVDLKALASTACDLLVIDYSRDGTEAGAFSADDIARLKRKQDGARRAVLTYLSIGEAEDYRFYWDRSWATSPPGWLRNENPDWPGNYGVRYWDTEWQRLIFGGDGSYLDRILASGSDGVYLDRIDAFELPDAERPAPIRKQSMTAFVAALAAYARARNPAFLVVAQNGEELLADRSYLDVIDALAKEDLFYGLNADGERNSASEIRESLDLIAPLRAVGKPLFLAEYLTDLKQRARAREDAASLGAVLFVGTRELDSASPC